MTERLFDHYRHTIPLFAPLDEPDSMSLFSASSEAPVLMYTFSSSLLFLW